MASKKNVNVTYPALPPDITIYAIGDIHGCLRLLNGLHERIDADMAGCRSRDIVEIYLGDYVDRGPDSSGVISSLMRRSKERKVVCIRGNHEQLLEQFVTGEIQLDDWLKYGGADTLRSYGATPQQLTANADELRRLIPTKHIEFIRRFDRHVHVGPYFFTHAGVRPGQSLRGQSAMDLMWIRDEFLQHDGDFGAIIVHGHTPIQEVEMKHNRICIDTGAYMTGRLSCVRIDQSGPVII